MQAGYTGLGTETAVGANQPDMKEMLRWARPLPDGHPLRRVYPHQYPDLLLPDQDVPGITGVLLALQESLFDLQRRFLRIVAVGLGVDPAFFDDLLVDAALLNRAIFYPRLPAEGAVRAGEHADINLLTVLLPSSVAGLEIKTSAGWMAVTPPDGRVVLNSGLMLERLTNGAILAHRHRVVTPESGSERLSIVQFCHPAPWMLLNPLPTCVTADRPLRYGAIQAGDIHQRVLWASRLMA
jgi:isopenicillin N synthase-like dioxygenase